MQAENEPPRVSVVIPNYWDGETVLPTLRSIQERCAVEVIVVDDASPDPSTADRLRDYESQGLIDTLLLKTTNEGVSAAVNDGVMAATAHYVWMIGNDDLLLPDTLGALADLLDANPSADFAMGGYQSFGSRRHRHVPPPWDPWKVLYRNLWCGALMVRREAYLGIGGMSDDSVYQDWDLYLTFAEHGHTGIVVPQPAYMYRVHGKHRMWAASRRSWGSHYRGLKRKHSQLFTRRRELRDQSSTGIASRSWYRATAFVLEHAPEALTAAILATVQGMGSFGRRKEMVTAEDAYPETTVGAP